MLLLCVIGDRLRLCLRSFVCPVCFGVLLLSRCICLSVSLLLIEGCCCPVYWPVSLLLLWIVLSMSCMVLSMSCWLPVILVLPSGSVPADGKDRRLWKQTFFASLVFNMVAFLINIHTVNIANKSIRMLEGIISTIPTSCEVLMSGINTHVGTYSLYQPSC